MEVNESELTSNMGNVLSTSTEKNETVDSTPTSSTDAFTKNEENTTVSDDPISSTSSELKEAPKIKDPTPSKPPTMDPDADMLGMEKGTGEKITENVEDLVHDLESLLGESTDSFNISNIRKKNNSVTKTSSMDDDDLMKDLEAELQGTSVKKEEKIEEPKEAEVISSDEPDRVTNITSELPEKIEELPVKTFEEAEKTNEVPEEPSPKIEEPETPKEDVTPMVEEPEPKFEEVQKEEPETAPEPDSQQELPKQEENEEKMDTTEETPQKSSETEKITKEVIEITELAEEPKNMEEIKDIVPVVEEPADESPKSEEYEIVVPVESATSSTEEPQKEEIESVEIEEISCEKEVEPVTIEEVKVLDTVVEEDEKVQEPAIVEDPKEEEETKTPMEVEKMDVSEEQTEPQIVESSPKDLEIVEEPIKEQPEAEAMATEEIPQETPVEKTSEPFVEEPKVAAEESSIETAKPVAVEIEETKEPPLETEETKIAEAESTIETEKPTVATKETSESSVEAEETKVEDAPLIEEPSNVEDVSESVKEDFKIEEIIESTVSTHKSSEIEEIETQEIPTTEEPLAEPSHIVEETEEEIKEPLVEEPEIEKETPTNTEEAMEVQENSSENIVEDVVPVLEEPKEEILNEKLTVTEEAKEEISNEKPTVTKEDICEVPEENPMETKEVIKEEEHAITENKVALVETPNETQENTSESASNEKPKETLNISSAFSEIAEVFSESFTSQNTNDETPKFENEETNQKSEVVSLASSVSEIISETSTEQRMCSTDSEIALSISQDVPEVSSESNECTKEETVYEKNMSEEDVEDMPSLQLESSMEEDEDIEKDFEMVEMSDVPKVKELPQEKLENKKVKSLFDTPNSSEASSPAVVEINDSTSDSVEEVKIQKVVEEIQQPKPAVVDFHQNLETLRAVESLKDLCGTSETYNEPSEDYNLIQAVESISQPAQEEPIAEEPISEKPEAEKVQETPESDLSSSPEVVSDETDILIGAANDAQKNLQEGKKAKKTHEKEKHTRCDKPLSINVDEVKESKVCSPKLIIKPLKAPEEEITTTSNEGENREPLKMTITKQSDKMHSILKIYNPNEVQEIPEDSSEQTVPKLIIKTTIQEQGSPKLTRRAYHSPTSSTPRSGSPRVTGKEANNRTPKLTIKPVVKLDDDVKEERSPKLNIKPIRPPEETEQVHSPKLRIKPIVKPEELNETPSPKHTRHKDGEKVGSPKVTIKPILKPHELEAKLEEDERIVIKTSPKVTIKPVIKPEEIKNDEDEVKERIVLKINKGNLTTPVKESRKRDHSEEKSEKIKKIKLKFSREGGQTHIVQTNEEMKMEVDNSLVDNDSLNIENVTGTPEVQINTVTPVSTPDSTPTPRKRGRPRKNPLAVVETPPMATPVQEIPQDPLALPGDGVKKSLEESGTPPAPESGRPKRSCRGVSVCDTLGIKPRKPRGGGKGRASARGLGTRAVPMKPAKEVKLSKARLKLLEKSAKEEELRKKEEFASLEKIEVIEIADDESTSEPLSEFSNNPVPSIEEPSIDLTQEDSNSTPIVIEEVKVVEIEKKVEEVVTVQAVVEILPPKDEVSTNLPEAMFEEETRMSAEANSRAQTPAKQVIATQMEVVEESQSSIQSTATVESGKTPAKNKGSRLEVYQEDTHIIAAEQLAEYYWNNNGPFMLQEQVAQFLGIKSFKRKYPNVQRRFVDMQERDFIRESSLASEAMCDLGLTAVCSADILDIMYNDFQDKYEEYCKYQRDKQTKEMINKQKAMCLAAIQDKNRQELTEHAIHSAANWNATFNRTRKEQRKASMDLQTLTVNYPKGKIKQIYKPKIGHYPVSLVPGQFTDFYQEFTPTEINNLPINTMCYDPINMNESESESSGSDSESDSSSSGSSSSGSCSDDDDCKVCVKIPQHQPIKKAAATSTK